MCALVFDEKCLFKEENMLNPPVEEQVEQELSELSINSKKFAQHNFQNGRIQQTFKVALIVLRPFTDNEHKLNTMMKC